MTQQTLIIMLGMNSSGTPELPGIAECDTTDRPASGSNPCDAGARKTCTAADQHTTSSATTHRTHHAPFSAHAVPVNWRQSAGVFSPVSVSGFTLIELVLVIIILGVLGSLGAGILLQPFKAFQDQSRRAAMVAEADLTLGYMARELRMALPNSVRVSGQFIEFIPTVDGGRYRSALTDANQGDTLDFSSPDNSFDVIGGLSTWGEPGGSKAGDHVVVFNTHATDDVGTNAYRGGNRQALSAYNTTTKNITLSAAKQFPAGSTSHRFDIVPATGPVTYYCNNGRLYRHTSYTFLADQPINFTDDGSVLADNISLCHFSYQAGTSTSSGVASLRLAITRDGETISLLYQVQIINAP